MNTKLNSLKEELKQIAVELKKDKPEYRKQESKISKERIDCWGSKEEREFCNDHWKLASIIRELKNKYRHGHIAYCLLKGKKYEQIEGKVREGNEPNWNLIKKIQEKYSETTEDVRVSA